MNRLNNNDYKSLNESIRRMNEQELPSSYVPTQVRGRQEVGGIGKQQGKQPDVGPEKTIGIDAALQCVLYGICPKWWTQAHEDAYCERNPQVCSKYNNNTPNELDTVWTWGEFIVADDCTQENCYIYWAQGVPWDGQYWICQGPGGTNCTPCTDCP